MNSPYVYGVFKINGRGEGIKMLTREKFKKGTPGLVYIDNKTGKMVFDD